MNIEESVKLDFDDVLLRPKFSMIESRKEIDLIRSFTFLHTGKTVECFPLMPSNMDSTGTMEMAKAFTSLNAFGCLHKYYDIKELHDYFDAEINTFYSLGIRQEDTDKLLKYMELYPDEMPKFVCLDIANGYTKKFIDMVKFWRDKLPAYVTIMAGNVVTPEAVERLLEAGASVAKIGIGSGSLCWTRIKTKIGYPQLSAIFECKDAAHGLKGHICSDGGCKSPGDICAAFAGGADFVMLGGMLGGTDQCSGNWTYRNKVIWPTYWSDKDVARYTQGGIDCPDIKSEMVKHSLKFYGMASKNAMEKYGNADYRTAEGKCVEVPYKGSVVDILQDIMGGLRSCCAYVGAHKLKDLNKCASFIRVNRTHNTIFGA